MADDKQLARQYVQELLTKIGQIDGEQHRDAVKHQIRDAGREYGRLKELVREQTALYAPELKERWEDILRRTEAARAGAVPASAGGRACQPRAAPDPPAPARPGGPAAVHARWGAEQRAAVLCRSTPPASIHRAVLTAPPLRRQLRLTAQQGRQQQQTFSRLRTRRTMRSLRSPTISPIPPRTRLVRPAPRPRSPRRQVATPCSTGGLPPMNASASSASSLASRDVVAKLQKEAGGGEGPSRLSFVLMDLGDLASVRKTVSELLERPMKGPGNTIAALMCNAAIAQVAKQKLTVDGLESQLGVNYMGHFLLCGLLFERLAACEARIVVVGSNGYKMGSKKINFDDLNWDHTYDPMAAYNQSKLAQTMFAFELQRRIQAAGKRHPAVFMCHPGASSTQLCKEEAGWFTSFLVRALMASPLFQSAEKGSWPEVMCATEASLCGTEPKMYGPTGSLEWKGPVGVCPLEEHALDREAAAALWTISEAKTGFKWHQI